MLSITVLLSAAALALPPLPEPTIPSPTPHAGPTCAAAGQAYCQSKLFHEVPVIDHPPGEAACTERDCLEAALAAWPYRLHFPRTPRPLSCWQRPDPWHLFCRPFSIKECLHHWERVLFDGTSDTNLRVCRDYEHFYGTPAFYDRALAIALAAPLANTNADQRVRDWYQNDVRSADTDRWARTGKNFGELWTIGVYGGVLLVSKATEDTWSGSLANEWADRCLRGVAVGGPAVLGMQVVLGGSRPVDDRGSHWHPFEDDNGVSGHAFLGAIPFLTAASMTENRLLRGTLFVASGWTAWSRVNDDQHYLSQALLGWYFAWQAVQSVNRTEWEERRVHLTPYYHPEGSGLAIHVRY